MELEDQMTVRLSPRVVVATYHKLCGLIEVYSHSAGGQPSGAVRCFCCKDELVEVGKAKSMLLGNGRSGVQSQAAWSWGLGFLLTV